MARRNSAPHAKTSAKTAHAGGPPANDPHHRAPYHPPVVEVREADPDPSAGELAQQVFVDSTGRRRRRVRLVAIGVGGLGLAYTAMVGMSLAGGA